MATDSSAAAASLTRCANASSVAATIRAIWAAAASTSLATVAAARSVSRAVASAAASVIAASRVATWAAWRSLPGVVAAASSSAAWSAASATWATADWARICTRRAVRTASRATACAAIAAACSPCRRSAARTRRGRPLRDRPWRRPRRQRWRRPRSASGRQAASASSLRAVRGRADGPRLDGAVPQRPRLAARPGRTAGRPHGTPVRPDDHGPAQIATADHLVLVQRRGTGVVRMSQTASRAYVRSRVVGFRCLAHVRPVDPDETGYVAAPVPSLRSGGPSHHHPGAHLVSDINVALVHADARQDQTVTTGTKAWELFRRRPRGHRRTGRRRPARPRPRARRRRRGRGGRDRQPRTAATSCGTPPRT